MSYNVAIVNFTLPESFEEACELVNPLTQQDVDDVEQIFKAFHDEVIKIYPCLNSLPDEGYIDH